jgi:hypothetical protein
MDTSSQNINFRFPSSAFLADRYGNEVFNNKTAPKCVFGGFTAAYEKGSLFSMTEDIKLYLYKPIDYKTPNEDYGKFAIDYLCETEFLDFPYFTHQ